MKIKIFDIQARKMKCFLKHKGYFSLAPNTGYGCICLPGLKIEFSTGTAIQRDASATSIEDEIETVFNIFKAGPYYHYAPAVLLKRKACNKSGGWRGNNFLPVTKKRQHKKK